MSRSFFIDVSSRFSAAFGSSTNATINSIVVDKEKQQSNSNDKNRYNVEIYGNAKKDIDKSVFIFNDTELVFNSMLKGDTSSVFAPPLLMTFSKEKDIIKTVVKGGDNVVVERFGTRPWEIDIRGILIDVENRSYPASEIEDLNELFEFNGIIKVIGEQFYDKNIDSIYISSISITPVEGFTDTIQFNISASSQKSVNYTLLNPIQ